MHDPIVFRRVMEADGMSAVALPVRTVPPSWRHKTAVLVPMFVGADGVLLGIDSRTGLPADYRPLLRRS